MSPLEIIGLIAILWASVSVFAGVLIGRFLKKTAPVPFETHGRRQIGIDPDPYAAYLAERKERLNRGALAASNARRRHREAFPEEKVG